MTRNMHTWPSQIDAERMLERAAMYVDVTHGSPEASYLLDSFAAAIWWERHGDFARADDLRDEAVRNQRFFARAASEGVDAR